jgi:hypothetical protein
MSNPNDTKKHDPLSDPFYFRNPFQLPIEVKVIDFGPKLPAWLDLVGRVMEKAADHLRAGRVCFTQVLVTKSDYEALVEHFGGDPMPVISTCIGPIEVYPANPDGVTFVD